MSITPENGPAASDPIEISQEQEQESAESVQEPIAQSLAPVLKTSIESGSATIRRAPKYGAFMTVGGGVGALVAFILTMSFPVDPAVGVAALFGYLCVFGIPAGVALGAFIALMVDRSSRRRAKPATIEHETVEPEAYEGELE